MDKGVGGGAPAAGKARRRAPHPSSSSSSSSPVDDDGAAPVVSIVGSTFRRLVVDNDRADTFVYFFAPWYVLLLVVSLSCDAPHVARSG